MQPNSALDHRDCPTVAVVESDDYPLGEHPEITTVDLCPLEFRVRAYVAMELTWGMLAHYIGLDLFPSIPGDFAELLHLPKVVVIA